MEHCARFDSGRLFSLFGAYYIKIKWGDSMKCDKLLQESNKKYKDMIASLDALKRGEISGSKANADIMRALDRVDELIKEYEKQ